MPRYSPQRELVLQIVQKSEGHLNVDEIFSRAQKKLPKISRATVYRNLQQLEEQKAVSHMIGPDQISYYEVFQDPHHHFVCRKCRSIRNLHEPSIKVCTSCITQKVPVQIEEVTTTLHGLCETCQ